MQKSRGFERSGTGLIHSAIAIALASSLIFIVWISLPPIVWTVVWGTGTIFHKITLTVLWTALSWEIYTVIRYWWADYQTDTAQINYLVRQKATYPIFQNLPWLSQHLLGEIEPEGGFCPQRGKDKPYVLVEYPNVIIRPVPRSSLRFIPTVCTALGLLGTFYGIQESIEKINLNVTSTQELIASSQQLLNGMKTAFSTSIMGLGSASLFILVLATCDVLRQKYRDDLRQKLNEIAILETSERILARADFSSNQLLTNQLTKAIANLSENLTGLNQLTATSIAQATGREVHLAFTPALRTIVHELRTMRELQEQQSQQVIRSLAEIVEPIIKRLEATADIARQTTETLQELQQELGAIASNLSGSIATIENFQQEILTKLQEFSQYSAQALSEFQSETRDMLEKTAQEIMRAINQSIAGVDVEKLVLDINLKDNQLINKPIQLSSNLYEQEGLEKQILEEVESQMSEILPRADVAFMQQSATLESVTNNAPELIQNAKANLIGSLRSIDRIFQSTPLTVDEELEQFKQEYNAGLQAFLRAQNQLLEITLKAQHQDLADILEMLHHLFQSALSKRWELSQSVDQNLEAIANATGDIDQKVERPKIIEISAASIDMTTTVDEIDADHQELSTTYREALLNLQNDIASYIQASVNAQTDFFRKSDLAIADACKDLLASALDIAATVKREQNK